MNNPHSYYPPNPTPKKKHPVLWGLLGVFVLLAAIGLFSSPDPVDPPNVQPADGTTGVTPTPLESFEGTIPQGTWRVPQEVSPGRYRSTGAKQGVVSLCSASTESEGRIVEWEVQGEPGAPVLLTVGEGVSSVENQGCETFVKID